MHILGISAYYHDSAAALVSDGNIIAAAQEERFTRKKHDPGFPSHAIKHCLELAGLQFSDLDAIAFYDKPLLKFERLLETYLCSAPKGFTSFVQSMPIWLKEKLCLKQTIKKHLCEQFGVKKGDIPQLLFTEHHQSHASSAFFASPFESAAVLCLDGVGEWATTTLWHGKGNQLKAVWECRFPHSLGLLYSALTYYLGFKVNSGEYKVMGLAPYGKPIYAEKMKQHLIDIKDDGSFRLNLDYFNYVVGLTMTNDKFAKLFGQPVREPESDLTDFHMDMAASIQQVTEEIVMKLCQTARTELNEENLCMAGGVALNCVANGKVQAQKIFKDIWVQPAAGDAGGALGAALSTWYELQNNPRTVQQPDSMKGSLLGPSFSNATIQQYCDSIKAPYTVLKDDELASKVSKLLEQGHVVGWFQGAMEFGPRALGARSILGDPRHPKMQSVMNLKIKYRESFRPFAPIVKADKVGEWFDFDGISPYMLMVAPVQDAKRLQNTDDNSKGIEKLHKLRSQIPAVTHVDYSARLQTVDANMRPRLYALLDAFEQRTGCPVLINTSFNVRGEPIVCNHEDAYRCFMRTEMDYLIMENVLLCKKRQPKWVEQEDWQKEFVLD